MKKLSIFAIILAAACTDGPPVDPTGVWQISTTHGRSNCAMPFDYENELTVSRSLGGYAVHGWRAAQVITGSVGCDADGCQFTGRSVEDYSSSALNTITLTDEFELYLDSGGAIEGTGTFTYYASGLTTSPNCYEDYTAVGGKT